MIRFGFHGISHAYAARRTAELLGCELKSLRMITCHLGNGCSLAAVAGGVSVDTTMGFTPLEGLMMGSRSGSIDPGIIVYLLRHSAMTASDLDRLLNEESGLQGLSGISEDMREIIAAKDAGDAKASWLLTFMLTAFAVKWAGCWRRSEGWTPWCLRAEWERIARRFGKLPADGSAFLGLEIDSAKNAQMGSRPDGDKDIASGQSAIRVAIVHSEEEWEIIRECDGLMQSG